MRSARPWWYSWAVRSPRGNLRLQGARVLAGLRWESPATRFKCSARARSSCTEHALDKSAIVDSGDPEHALGKRAVVLSGGAEHALGRRIGGRFQRLLRHCTWPKKRTMRCTSHVRNGRRPHLVQEILREGGPGTRGERSGTSATACVSRGLSTGLDIESPNSRASARRASPPLRAGPPPSAAGALRALSARRASAPLRAGPSQSAAGALGNPLVWYLRELCVGPSSV